MKRVFPALLFALAASVILNVVQSSKMAQIYPPGAAPTPSPTPHCVSVCCPACPATPEPTPNPSPSPTPSPTPTPAPTPTPGLPPLPSKAGWEANMTTKGRDFCEAEKRAVDAWAAGTGSIDACMSYYDGEEVFYNVSNYDVAQASYWKDCSQAVERCYRGSEPVPAGTPLPGSKYPYGYTFGNGGGLPGYWAFSEGTFIDFNKTQDANSKAAVIMLSQKAAYCTAGTSSSGLSSATMSREVAYCVRHYLHAEKLGEAHRTQQDQYTEFMFGHVDQWVNGTYRAPNPFNEVPAASGQFYFQPFMGGLTARTLIMIYEQTSDATLKGRIYDAVRRLATFTQTVAWDPNTKAWWYENWAPTVAELPAKAGSPDLNLLILPMYGWLYSIDGDRNWISIGDAAFDGGVKGAWFGSDKHYNQNYTWSFDYVKWRASLPKKGAVTITVER